MERFTDLSWGKEENDLAKIWPKLPDGTPEKPVFLTTAGETNGEAALLTEKLRAYDIPVMKKYEKGGSFGRVILGVSGFGVGLYVPESRLSEAQDLLAPSEEPTEEEQ